MRSERRYVRKRLRGALSEIGRHRVRGIADEHEVAAMPARQWRQVGQRQVRALAHGGRGQHARDWIVPARELARETGPPPPCPSTANQYVRSADSGTKPNRLPRPSVSEATRGVAEPVAATPRQAP